MKDTTPLSPLPWPDDTDGGPADHIPPALVGALAHSLREEGVAVQPYDMPHEHRGMGDITHEVVIELVATGTVAAIGAAITKFRKWFPGRGSITTEPEDGGDD